VSLPPAPAVASILSRGSGAYVIHMLLASRIANYRCHAYDPRLEYCPPLMLAWRRHAAPIVHVPADYGSMVTPRRSRLVATFHNYYLDPGFARSGTLVQRLHYRTDLRWFTRRSIARADLVTAVSQFIADLVREDLGYRGEIRVLPNGIDVTRFQPRPEPHEGLRVLFCGNLSRRKGANLLPGIAAGLAPGIELWVASGLREGQAALALPSNVRLVGRVPFADMPELYNRADILVMPTLREGFGLAVAEAMACGLPVVATRCSAIPELLVHGEGGYLVTPGQVDEFVERLNLLAADPALRARMGAFNRARIVADFREDSMVSGYQALFAELAP